MVQKEGDAMARRNRWVPHENEFGYGFGGLALLLVRLVMLSDGTVVVEEEDDDDGFAWKQSGK